MAIAFGVILGIVGERFLASDDDAPPASHRIDESLDHAASSSPGGLEPSSMAREEIAAPRADASAIERAAPSSAKSSANAASLAAGSAKLVGTVKERETHRKVANVSVVVEAGRPWLTTTDEYGDYSIDDLPVGEELRVTVRASETNETSGRITFVVPGTRRLDFVLAPRERIAGVVVERGTRAPIADAVVSIGRGSRVFETRTDLLGGFEILLDREALRACREVIVRASLHCATRLDVAALDFPATIELLPAARVEGIVVDAAGTPAFAFVESTTRRALDTAAEGAAEYANPAVDPSGIHDAYARYSDAAGRFSLPDAAPFSRHTLRAFTFGDPAGGGVQRGEVECVTEGPGSTVFARIVLARHECAVRVTVSERIAGKVHPVDGARVIVTQFDERYLGAVSREAETSGFDAVTEIEDLLPGLATVRVERPGSPAPPLQRIELEPGRILDLRFVFDHAPGDHAGTREVRVIDATTGESVRECSVEWRRLGTSSWGVATRNDELPRDGVLASSIFGKPNRAQPMFVIDPPAGRIVVVARAHDGTCREGVCEVSIEALPADSFSIGPTAHEPIVVAIAAKELGTLRLEFDATLELGAPADVRRLFVRSGAGDAWIDRFDLLVRAATESGNDYELPVGEYTVLSGPAGSGEPDREHGRVEVAAGAVTVLRVPPSLR